MKKTITDFIRKHKCSAHYSGRLRTMFIRGNNAEEVEQQILDAFGYSMPFKISSDTTTL